jgi:hypothetical protein
MENTLHCNVCNFTGITQTHFIKHILTQKTTNVEEKGDTEELF